jgi:nucleotide-binding universal stress UspA family protein
MTLYRNILVPVDGSATSECGLREAVRFAGDGKTQLVLLHVVNELSAFANIESRGFAVDVAGAMAAEGRRVLDEAQALAARLGVETSAVLCETLGGSAADQIVLEAGRQGSDLIVMGTHGRRGVKRLVLGSDAETVVRNSPVPVLLVRGDRRGKGG